MKRLILCVLLLILSSCTKEYTQINEIKNVDHSLDALSFKNDYEAINQDSIYKLEIEEDNPIQYHNIENINNILKSGTGVIFLGSPTNIYSRVMVSSLLKQAKIYDIDTIYYLDMQGLRDEKYLDDDGKIAIRKEAAEGYDELLLNLKENASIYDGLNNEEVKRVYLPTIVIVVEGEIIYFHEGTLASQDNPNLQLNEEQLQELDFDLTIGFVRYNARVKELTQIIQEEKESETE